MTEEQKELPGIESEIPELQDRGVRLADVRKRRMELTRQESELAGEILSIMKDKELRAYKSHGLSLEIKVTKERIKVRVEGDEDDDDEKE